MVEINRYLAHPNKSKTNIFFNIWSKGKRLRLTSKLSIETKYWDSNKQRIKSSYTYTVHANKTLDQLQQFIERECVQHYDKYNTIKFDELKSSFKSYQELGKKEKLTFTSLIDEFIEYKKKSLAIKDRTIRGYLGFKKNIIDFQEHTNKIIDLEDINQDLLINFKGFLTKECGYKDNSISYKLTLKNVILNYAFKKRYIDNQDYKEITNKKYQTESVALSDNDIEKLLNYKPNNKQLYNTKHYFLFQLYSGLRVSDIVKLTKEKIDLENETIKIVTEKTNKIITIPISKQLKEVLNVFDVTKFTKGRLSSYSVALKTLCKEAGINDIVSVTSHKNNRQIEENKPKYELVSSHTARRTFITRLIQKGVSPSEIMQITGHTSRASFDKYIRIANTEAVSNVKDKLNEM